MSIEGPSSVEGPHAPFRATQLWQKVITGFRAGMPRHKKRVKMRQYENCFTGGEAVEWLHSHLQSTGLFGSPCRQQVERLLQKFLESDVIVEVRGKVRKFNEEDGYLYQFVTEPGPLNFVEEESEKAAEKAAEEPARSPLGKHPRTRLEPYDGTLIANEYAFVKCSENLAKQPRRSATNKLAVFDVNTQSTKLSPSQVAEVWKELTLARLLCLVELPTLDGVLAHDAVDGKHIVHNVNLVARLFMSKARQHPPQLSSEAVTDVPQWVVLAMRCLAKWPEGCTEEFVGGMPVYYGFELDVLQSLVQFFSLPDPLISPKLYDLYMAVLQLIHGKKPGAVNALQLCSLLLPQTNRLRLHRVLRLINKAGGNTQLQLSKTQTNRQVLLDAFSTLALRPSSKGCCSEQERTDIQTLVSFLSLHYQQVFTVPDDLKREVQQRLQTMTSGKTDSVVSVHRSFCYRVSHSEYEQQKVSTSQECIAALLDRIVADKSMPAKIKKQRLKTFQKEYPEIYAQRFPPPGEPAKPSSNSVVFCNMQQILR